MNGATIHLKRGMWLRPIQLLLLLVCIPCDAFRCNEKCTCIWRGGKMAALCSEVGLKGLPRKMDEGVQVLNITKNTIRSLPNDAFIEAKLVNLQKLYMAYCDLNTISDSAFNTVYNLVELDLSYNKLQKVPTFAMRQLRHLRTLNLRGNVINTLSSSSFSNLTELVTLELAECSIEKIDRGAFADLEKLAVLKLDHNRLTTLSDELASSRFQHMHMLTLHNNFWECDCNLRALKIKFFKNTLSDVSPKCQSPSRLKDREWKTLSDDEFSCPPKLVPEESKPVSALMGDNANLSCRVSSIPRAEIRWFRNAVYIGNCSENKPRCSIVEDIYMRGTQALQTSNLTLYNVDASSSGGYSCLASNPSGSVRQNFSLQVTPFEVVLPGNLQEADVLGNTVSSENEQYKYPWYIALQERPLMSLIVGIVLGACAVLCIFGTVMWACRRGSRRRLRKHDQRNENTTKIGETNDVSKENDSADLKLLGITQTKPPQKPPRSFDYRTLPPLDLENPHNKAYTPSGCMDDSGSTVWIVRDHLNSTPYSTLPRDRRSTTSNCSSLRSPLAVPAPMIPGVDSNVLHQLRLQTELAHTMRRSQQRPVSEAGSESSSAPLLNFNQESELQSPYDERPPSCSATTAPDLLMSHDGSTSDFPPSMPLLQPTVWNGAYVNNPTSTDHSMSTYFRTSSSSSTPYSPTPPNMLPTLHEGSDGTEV